MLTNKLFNQIDNLIKSGKLNVEGIRNQWESFLLVTIENPLPGVKQGLVIAGSDRKFVFADAKIEDDAVVVSSPQVPNPVAVRYGWADLPRVNLFNKDGFPASPFRTDEWPLY